MQLVGQQLESPWRLRMLDVGGGLTCALLLATAAWTGGTRLGQVQRDVAAVRAHSEAARHSLTTLQAAASRQEALVASRQKELGERGRLPASPPIEEYLEALTAIAAQHQLNVISHSPGIKRRYGDVVEHCISFQVAGTAAGLLRFLRAIEQSSFWADVGYLRIEAGEAPAAVNAAPRRASLVFSLFAAAPQGPGSGQVKP